jgi:DNA-binding MarR family transcriptional regulator
VAKPTEENDMGEDAKKIRINERERLCLEKLVNDVEDEGWALFMFYIVEHTGLTIKEVRRALRSLKKKGLAELVRGVMDEDTGMLAGSGYAATRAGIDFLSGDSYRHKVK